VCKWLKKRLTFNSSTAKWGFLQFISTVSFFCATLSVASFSVYLLSFAVFAVISVVMGFVWMFKYQEDPMEISLRNIEKILKGEQQQRQNIQVVLGVLDWLIGKFRGRG